jgi:hypothetical protein
MLNNKISLFVKKRLFFYLLSETEAGIGVFTESFDGALIIFIIADIDVLCVFVDFWSFIFSIIFKV